MKGIVIDTDPINDIIASKEERRKKRELLKAERQKDRKTERKGEHFFTLGSRSGFSSGFLMSFKKKRKLMNQSQGSMKNPPMNSNDTQKKEKEKERKRKKKKKKEKMPLIPAMNNCSNNINN
jgi:hypothetical protein